MQLISRGKKRNQIRFQMRDRETKLIRLVPIPSHQLHRPPEGFQMLHQICFLRKQGFG